MSLVPAPPHVQRCLIKLLLVICPWQVPFHLIYIKVIEHFIVEIISPLVSLISSIGHESSPIIIDHGLPLPIISDHEASTRKQVPSLKRAESLKVTQNFGPLLDPHPNRGSVVLVL